jgi:hypothetical protein
MIDWLHQYFAWFYGSLDSLDADFARDVIALACSLLPAMYLSIKFMFRDSESAKTLTRSRAVIVWLFLFCSIQVYLHIVKASLALKIIITIFALIPLAVILGIKEIIG